MITHDTFEREAARLAGATPPPLDVAFSAPGYDLGIGTSPRYGSRTRDGHWVEPTESVAAALLGHIRRVVHGADSVVIDIGRRQRLFTGAARDAALFASTHCAWPGCLVPASQCQTDHLEPWDRDGTTSPTNGAPLCGRHNRFKHNNAYTIARDQHGRLHTSRPDGTRVA